MTKYYVTMTDKCLSGWNRFEASMPQTVKFVYLCDTYQDALIVEDNAKARGDQLYVRIRVTKPRPRQGVKMIFKTKEDGKAWYQNGEFRRQKRGRG